MELSQSGSSKTYYRDSIAGMLIVLGPLLLIYLPTLQTFINGSSDDFMNDTGEVQVVLNTWGTLHATGYPLFVILGNLLVSAMKWGGIPPATAPALTAMLWGFIALALFYWLSLNFTQSIPLAMATTWLFGLTRYVWIHNVISEVYSFTLLFQILLFVIALMPRAIPHRLEWLALIGGLGIGHHRGLILCTLPILYAVLPQLNAEIRKQPFIIFKWLLLGFVGLVPYVYLPFRAHTDPTWVYGSPGTLSGLWDQFIAREAPRIIALPESLDTLIEKFSAVNALLANELTIAGILIGTVGIAFAIANPRHRRAGITLAIYAVSSYFFLIALFTDITAPIVFPITMSLVIGWLFLFDTLLHSRRIRQVAFISLAPIAVTAGGWLIMHNSAFIYDLTHDPTGLEMIELAKGAPAGSTLMLEWGTRYYAVGFAQDVLGELKQIHRANDRADVAALVARGTLVVPDYVLYAQPIAWWEKKLETQIYPRAAAPHLIQIATTPQIIPNDAIPKTSTTATLPIAIYQQSIQCSRGQIILQVDWLALNKPPRDLSIFVHLLDRTGGLLAQSDQSAPVYSWRPLTSWQAGEIVHDVYPLPFSPNGVTIEFGFYEKLASGEFKNYNVTQLPLPCNNQSRLR